MNSAANSRILVPSFMYGTAWKKEATADLVEMAVNAGFRAIDTANQLKHYDEKLVGDALKRLEHHGIQRKDLFLQTKFTSVDGQDHRLPYDPKSDLTTQVQQSFNSSLEHLHTDYLDSYILHGPYSRYGLSGADWEVWRAIESIYAAGQAKLIGVSNVTAEQLAKLCSDATTKPMMVQNRCYAIQGWDKEVRKICNENNIIYQGFSLLTANANFLSSPRIQSIAQRTSATAAQIIFRFSTLIGMLPLTGTTNKQHMLEDLKSESVELTEDDLAAIENIALK
ncbi:MAG: aldo/keto reductase [Candidatus Obscuribacterales bacterium]|nr:aldo/keto reductase [Candidatus Obscuribacterales bacterium]